MPQTLTFTKVFTAEGAKNGKAWKRWDFKTADGERYSTFNESLANQVVLNQPVSVEVKISPGGNGYMNRTLSAVLSGSKPEESQQSSEGSEAVRTAPVAPQPHVQDNVRGKCFTMIAAGAPAALFSSLPEDEQSFEAMVQIINALVDKALEA